MEEMFFFDECVSVNARPCDIVDTVTSGPVCLARPRIVYARVEPYACLAHKGRVLAWPEDTWYQPMQPNAPPGMWT